MNIVKNPRLQLFAILILIAVAATLGATVAGEVVMLPSEGERSEMIGVWVSIAVTAVVIAAAFFAFGRRSIGARLLLVAMSGPVIIAVSIYMGSRSMFVSQHDLQFLFILLGFATILTIAIVMLLGRSLAMDLKALANVASRIGAGDLTARVELARMDEVGDLARSLDTMATEIASVRSEREQAERQRWESLAALSHDARTPLTSIRLASEAISDGVARDPERYLHSIRQQVDAIETLMGDMFTVGELELGKVQLDLASHDFVEMLATVIDMATPIANSENVAISYVGPESAQLEFDATKAQRIVMNLIDNAVCHSPDAGIITIKLDDDLSQLTVSDEGPGFDPEFTSRAFTAFERFDEARNRNTGGAGLGLAVAKGFADAHGWGIEADPGPGGKVRIILR